MEAISALPDDGDNVLLLNTVEGESDVLEVLDRVIKLDCRQEARGTQRANARAKRVEERAQRKPLEIALEDHRGAAASARLERPICGKHHAD